MIVLLIYIHDQYWCKADIPLRQHRQWKVHAASLPQTTNIRRGDHSGAGEGVANQQPTAPLLHRSETMGIYLPNLRPVQPTEAPQGFLQYTRQKLQLYG